MSKIGAKVLNGQFTIGEDGDNCAHIENNNKLWLAGQINRLDALSIQHISVDMDAGYKDNKFTKTVSGFGKYADITRETNFNENKNATVLFMGNNYDNIILLDVDNIGDTVDTFLKFYEEQQIPECGLVETTINGGLHLYYKLDEEQHEQIKGFKSADKQMFPDFLPLDKKGKTGIDIKYTNQLSYGPAYVDAEEQVSKTGPPIIHKSKTEIIVSEGLFYLPDIIFNEIKRIYENKDIKKKPAEKKTSKKQEETVEEEEETEEMRKSREAIDKELETEDMQKIDNKLTDYLNLLKPERWDHRGEWLKIGAIIKNEGGSFKLFDTYSKNSEKYETVSTRKLWDSLIPKKDKQARLGSLKYMAKQDTPLKQLYEVVDNKYISDVEKMWTMDYTDEALAKIFYAKYPKLFMYEPNKNAQGEWYTINDVNIWDTTRHYIALDNKIVELTESLRLEFKQLMDDEKEFNELKPKQIEALDKKYKTICKKLETQKTHKDLHDALKKYYFSSPKFDKIPHLVGFKNGVYDAENFEFRKAKPEEMVHLTTGYDFKQLEEDDKDIKAAKILLESIHGDNTEFILTCASLGIGGANILELILFHVGPGSNGKSLYADILEATFGELSYAGVPSSMFIEEGINTKSKPDPFLLEFESKRFVCSGEGKKKAILDNALIKSLSGNDKQRTRDLHKSKIEGFKLMCIINMFTNYYPQIDGDDAGIRRRTIILKYKYNFVDKVVKPNDRLIDRTIKSKLDNDTFKNAVFNLLLGYYKQFIKNNKKLAVPQNIREHTDNYLHSIAPISFFVANHLELLNTEIKNIKEREGLDMWYNIYKSMTDTPIAKTLFKLELEKKDFIFKNSGGTYTCINGKRIKSAEPTAKTAEPQEEDEEEDEEIEQPKKATSRPVSPNSKIKFIDN